MGSNSQKKLLEGWCYHTLSDLGEVNRGRSRYRPRYAAHLYGGKYPFIQTGDVKNSTGKITCHFQTYNEEGLAQSRLWPEGTMCITIAANIAETAILTYPACFPDSIVGFIPDSNKCNGRYVYYLFQYLKSSIQHEATGSVQDNINLETLKRLNLFLPPLNEQQRISQILGTLDDRIELNRQMNETLEEITQALFKSWFVDFDPVIDKALAAGKEIPAPLQEKASLRQALGNKRKPLPADIAALFPDEFEESELGVIPKGWIVGTLGDICFVKGGYAYKSKDFGLFGCPVIKINNIKNDKSIETKNVDHVSETIAKKTIDYQIRTGDLLMAMTGATVGKFGLIVTEPNMVYLLNQRVANFAPLKHIGSKIWFIYNCLCQPSVINQIINTAHGSAQPNISANAIMCTKITIPLSNIITKFDHIVDDTYTKYLENRNNNNNLLKLRDTLLPKLISGEIRIPDAEAIVEEALNV